IEAELMSRRDAEPAVRLVLGASQDGAEAVAAAIAIRTIEQQLVESLLGEEQRAALADDFELDLHFATERKPARLDGAVAAACKAHECACDVIDFHRTHFPGARAHWTLLHHGLELPAHGADRAKQITRDGDDVAA